MNKFARSIKLSRRQRGLLAAVATGALAAGANATVDVTAITSTATDVAAVGAAVFAVIVGIYGYKWIRRSL